MQFVKSVTRLMLVVALMLGALTLGAQPAEASSSGPICEQGELVDGQCETEVDPVFECPALEDDGECFELVSAIETCETGTPLGDGSCRVTVPDTIELSCPPPSQPGDDGCITIVPADTSEECPDGGDVVDGECLVFIASAVQESFCPNAEDADGCYTTVPAEFSCAQGVPSGDMCLVEIAPNEEPDCPNPTFTDLVELEDGLHCGNLFAGTLDCGLAEDIGNGECREAFFSEGCQIYIDEFSELYQFIEEDGGSCYGFDFDNSPPCVPPAIPIFEGDICGVLLGLAGACPDGFSFDEDSEQCVRIFGGIANCDGGLFLGYNDGGDPLCFEDFGLATFSCPDGSPAIEGCIVAVPGDYVCEVGSIIETTECRIGEDPELSEPFCPVGLLIDDGCYEIGTPVIVYSCPVGLVDGATCVIVSEPTEMVSCGDAQGDPGDCFVLEPAGPGCPPGTAPGAEFPEDCREPVEGVGTCSDSATEVDGRCVEYSDPVWFCNGELVTINMILGDSGNGTAGNDVILGTPGNDNIRGRAGNDTICGGGGNDRISGNNGNDTIFGEAGNDRISGNNGNDYLDGGADDDRLFGGSGDDVLRGGTGDDTLRGQRGNDDCQGGPGGGSVRQCE